MGSGHDCPTYPRLVDTYNPLAPLATPLQVSAWLVGRFTLPLLSSFTYVRGPLSARLTIPKYSPFCSFKTRHTFPGQGASFLDRHKSVYPLVYYYCSTSSNTKRVSGLGLAHIPKICRYNSVPPSTLDAPFLWSELHF